MKRLLLLLIVVPLLAASSAEAKGLKWVEVCGPSDCTRTPGSELDFEKFPLIFPPWVMSGKPDKPPQHAAPWLRVRVAVSHSDRRMSSVVIPALGYAGGDQGGGYGYVWQRLSEAQRRTYLHLGHGLAKYPAATLPGLERSSPPRAHAPGSGVSTPTQNARSWRREGLTKILYGMEITSAPEARRAGVLRELEKVGGPDAGVSAGLAIELAASAAANSFFGSV